MIVAVKTVTAQTGEKEERELNKTHQWSKLEQHAQNWG